MSVTQTPRRLEASGISKTYPGVRALRDVSFHVDRGEVLGLIGENGAGKSTLLNVLCGTERPDRGEIRVDGRLVTFADYHDATSEGVFRIFQELALVPNLRVYENFFLAHERRFERFGVLPKAGAIEYAQDVLRRFDHGWIDARAQTGSYPFAVRQVLEIIKAFSLAELLGTEVPVLLLDEPTAALAASEVTFLYELIDSVRQDAAIVFVSHRLSEICEWSDRVVVMKDGQVVAESTPAASTEDDLHYLMVGRRRDEAFYREHSQGEPGDEALLRADGLTGDGFHDVSLELRAGEILGIGGLLGSGKSELGRALFGASPWKAGTVEVDREPVAGPDIASSVRRRVAYVPPERREDGVFLEFPVAWNVSFASIVARPVREGGWRLRPRFEDRLAETFIDRLQVRPPYKHALARTLSGGNQQKIVLARWLALGIRVLILDNPTRGIDAGAKEEIYGVLRDVAATGVGILLLTDDILELIGLSNRILVMKDGVVAGELEAPRESKPREAQVVAMMS